MLTNKISKLFDDLLESLNKHNVSVNATVTREFERNLDELNELLTEAANLIEVLAVLAGYSDSTAVKNVMHNLSMQELEKDAMPLPIPLDLPLVQLEQPPLRYNEHTCATGKTRHRVYKPWFGTPVLVLQREYASYYPPNPLTGMRSIQKTWWVDATHIEGL